MPPSSQPGVAPTCAGKSSDRRLSGAGDGGPALLARLVHGISAWLDVRACGWRVTALPTLDAPRALVREGSNSKNESVSEWSHSKLKTWFSTKLAPFFLSLSLAAPAVAFARQPWGAPCSIGRW